MAAVVVVAIFDPVENIGVGDMETSSAGRQRLVEVEEAGCMLMGLKLAGVCWKYKWVCHRLVGDMRRMLQLIWRAMLPSVGRDSLPFGRLPTRDRR